MELAYIWFFIVGLLLIGYFVLDGFDFGVGMAMPFVSKDDIDRRVVINTIGPVWDLNETWIIVGGACLFAAFPEWYATMFSGFYLALLLILVALILRGVSFEYRHQGKQQKWKAWFDGFIITGSFLPPLLWGTAFANLIHGIPLEKIASGGWQYTGDLFTLLNPYSLLGGITVTLLCFNHGLAFLTLKAEDPIRGRARELGKKVGILAILAGASFLIWTIIEHLNQETTALVIICAAITAVALIGAWLSNIAKKEGASFSLNVVTIAFALFTIFFALFPNVMIANDYSQSMTILGASSSDKTLQLMTWVAVIMLPLSLCYQAWTYWIFKKRISRKDIPVKA